MQSYFNKARIFLYAFIVMFLLCFCVLILFHKAEIHIFINRYHSSFFDSFFMLYTHVGDGYFALFIAALMLFYSFKASFQTITAFMVMGTIIGIIKRTFFYGTPRPLMYFENIYKLYVVPGLEPNLINSFPSGHSASAFALFLCLTFIVKRKFYSILFFFFAVLVCYSRMYLSEHFLIDIAVGSYIGVFSATLVYLVFEKYGQNISDKSVIYLLGLFIWKIQSKIAKS